MAHPPEVQSLLDGLLPGICAAIGNNFTGAYLAGSLALGGYDPQTSDVDILVVTERPLSNAEMARLSSAHAWMPPSYQVPGRDYEVYYIDRATIRKFAPGQRHVKIEPDTPLYRTEHRPGWVIERWIVREHGVTLAGPDPKILIGPVSPNDMRWAAAEELRLRDKRWRDGTWPLSEMAQRGTQTFEVETVCRALYTIATGEASSKRDAVEWALNALPGEWRDLVEWSQRHKKDMAQDETRMPETLKFLAWAVAKAPTS
jgi:Aminoglycoside adenylyltransferase, C-terminal domain/Nucleotidyltransferase domain